MTLDVTIFGALVVTALAACCDLRTRRIPNELTVGALLAGLAVTILAQLGVLSTGEPTTVTALLVTVVGTFFVTLVGFSCGLLGGGDAKLMVALAAWLGFPAILEVALYSIVAAVALFVGTCVAQGRARACLRSIAVTFGGMFFPRLRRLADDEVLSLRLPFGVAVLAALVGWQIENAVRFGGLA